MKSNPAVPGGSFASKPTWSNTFGCSATSAFFCSWRCKTFTITAEREYQHYYFGDYYAANYRGAGFHPWFSINTGRFGYNPIYAYDRWQHRQDSGWEQRQQADFQNRRDHEDFRPPRTWADQREMNARAVQAGGRIPVVATSLDDFRRNKNSPLRFQPVDQSERKQFSQHAQEVQRFREERQKLETNTVGAPAETRTKEFVPARVRLSGSPIVAKPGADFGKDRAPPKMYKAPKPDPTVAAKSRVNRSADQSQQRTVNRMPLDQPRTQPQPLPRVERAAPQPPPKVERQAPPPRDDGRAAGSKQDKHQGKNKN